MNEKPTSGADKVSLSKPTGKPGAPPEPPAQRPRSVLLAAGALVLAGLCSLIAALDLYGLRDWLTSEQKKANAKAITKAVNDAAKAHKDQAKARADEIKKLGSVAHQVSQQQSGALIGAIVVVVAISFLVYGVYRGRHWSRWAVIGFWFLASFTGTLVGLGAVLNLGSSAPAAFKVPAFFAGAAMIAAVVLVNLKPSTAYFALHRPVTPAGAPARRGLFAPRTPPARSQPRTGLGSSAASRGEAYVQRQRAKKRAAENAESIARGAELARQRAKASKSRRVGQ